MRSRSIVAALFVLFCTAGTASAQVLSLEFVDGRVRLTAENVPVSRILDEWTRVGGTQIVNGERIPGAPVTLTLVDTPERQALDTILRGAAGYMVLGRDTAPTGASSFEKILVLPTTARVAVTAPPQPAARPPQFPRPEPEPIEPEEVDDNPPGPTPPPGFPRGRTPNLNLPNAAPPQESEDDERNDDDSSQDAAPVAPSPGNPFGVLPGGARPGTITPPPAPREPNADQPR